MKLLAIKVFLVFMLYPGFDLSPLVFMAVWLSLLFCVAYSLYVDYGRIG